MELSIQKTDVVDVLAKMQGLTGRRSNLAITENVLVDARDTEITLSATDLETGFEGVFPAEVNTAGRVAINARKFYEIVREFPNDRIHMAVEENNWIKIANEKVEFHIVGMDPDDFPEIPRPEKVAFFTVNGASLKRMIERSVQIGGPSDDKRAHIIGVLMEQIGQEEKSLLRFVSTDGNRLARVDSPLESLTGDAMTERLIVPKKALAEVNRFISADDTVSIGVKDNHVIFKLDSETLIIRQLEGDFPAYEEVFKHTADARSIHLNRQAFVMLLRRMSILSSETYKGVIFNFNRERLLITSTNPEIGESKEDIAITYPGDDIEVAFNPRYFIEALNAMSDEGAVLNIVDGSRPCSLHAENDITFVSVIMPMRL